MENKKSTSGTVCRGLVMLSLKIICYNATIAYAATLFSAGFPKIGLVFVRLHIDATRFKLCEFTCHVSRSYTPQLHLLSFALEQ